MPIRSSEKARYPQDWKAIRARILARAQDRCECQGECGLHPPNPQPRRCIERHHTPAIYARGQIVLTIAHLGDPSPENCADDNLKAMCQRCHLRYDHEQHMKNSAATRRAKRNKGSELPL